jgi:hypothetical protein
MSISYNLDMETVEPVAQIARQLCDIARSTGLFNASVTPETVLGEGAVTWRGMWFRVGEEKPQPWHPVISDLGFTPMVWVRFQLAGSSEHRYQQDDMIRLASGLLDKVPGDAVLHFQFETIWLLRSGAELSLNERDDLWPPRRLAAVSQFYCRATYEFSQE